MNRKFFILFFVPIFFLTFIPGDILAQEEKKLEMEKILFPEGPSSESCFDYYEFGSVDVEIVSSASKISAGSDLDLIFNIKNTNPYPLINGGLYVKIMRDRPEGQEINAPAVVDQFFVAEDLVVDANSSTTTEYTWRIPAYSKSGEYKVATFFVTDKKHNLAGLSFTDDVLGNSKNFFVISENENIVEFDKDSVRINKKPYAFAAFPPDFEKNESIEIVADIVNDTNVDEVVEYKWTVYEWDALKEENKIMEYNSAELIKSNNSFEINYVVQQNTSSVYLVVGEVFYKDTKSIIGVRLVRNDVPSVRINFPSLVSFPIIGGEKNTIFSCFHHSGNMNILPKHTMKLTLEDIKGDIIEEQIYEGPVTSSMLLIKKEFIPDKSYDYVILNAELANLNGEIIDSSRIIYDCEIINPENCIDSGSSIIMDIIKIMVGTILLLVLLLGIGFYFKKRKGGENNKKIITQ